MTLLGAYGIQIIAELIEELELSDFFLTLPSDYWDDIIYLQKNYFLQAMFLYLFKLMWKVWLKHKIPQCPNPKIFIWIKSTTEDIIYMHMQFRL